MSLEAEYGPPALRVPHGGCPVGAAGRQAQAVRAEGHSGDLTLLPWKAAFFLARNHVPHRHQPVLRTGGQKGAVRTKSHHLSAESVYDLASVRVTNDDHLVERGTGQPPSAAAKGHAVDNARGPRKGLVLPRG